MMSSVEIWATMRQTGDGAWHAETWEETPREADGPDQETCLEILQEEVEDDRREGEPLTIVVQVLPVIAGVAEAAHVMEWDKRRVITYIDRGRFPEPLQALASGRIWIRSDIEDYAEEWRARQAARGKATKP